MKKRLFSIVMTCLMCISLMPAGASAADNKAAPVKIEVNKTISGSQTASFTNYYTFTVTTPSKVEIELKAEDGSSYVTLGQYNNGVYKAFRSDYAPFRNDTLGYSHYLMNPFRLAPGEYYVAIDSDKNKWDLTVHCWDETSVNAERAPNSSFDTATSMKLNTDYIGNNSFAGSDKADYFSFVLPSAGTISYRLDYPKGDDKECDKTVTLYDKEKKQLQYMECGFNNYKERTSYTSKPMRLPAGQYYVSVHEYIGNSWNYDYDYTLCVNYTDESGGGYEVEPNGAIAQANPLPLGQTIQGSQNDIDDEDHFRVTLTQDSALKITLACNFTDTRTHCVRVFDANGEMVGDKWNAPSKAQADFTTNVLKAGIYYVQVADYEYTYWTSEPYRLTVEAVANQVQLPQPTQPVQPTQPTQPTYPTQPSSNGEAATKAAALKGLGLFKGVSDTDFALNRKPTRVEALVMFIRLIGAEEEATMTQWQHPFLDVPSWANSYVGYAYQQGYTQGVSSLRFGTNQTAGANMYLTFMLRALAYSDGYDFQWDDPYTLAQSINLLPSNADTANFMREDVVLISWSALSVPLKEGNKALGDILVMNGTFTQSQLDAAFGTVSGGTSQQTPTSPTGSIAGVKYGTYVCKKDSYGFVYDPSYRPSITLNSDSTFSFTMNFGEGMLTVTGTYSAVEDDTYHTAIFLDVNGQYPGAVVESTYLFTADFGPNRIGLTDGGAGITPVESVFDYIGQ